MTDSLTARLLAEIERREGINGPHGNYGHGPFVDEMAAYLAALRKIVELCDPYDDMQVRRQTRTLAGRTLRAVATALDVTP